MVPPNAGAKRESGATPERSRHCKRLQERHTPLSSDGKAALRNREPGDLPCTLSANLRRRGGAGKAVPAPSATSHPETPGVFCFTEGVRVLRRKFGPLFAAGAALLLFAGGLCAFGPTASASSAITFKDDLGHVVRLKHPATRILPLGPSNAEILLALGLRKDIIGADSENLQYMPKPYAGRLKGLPVVGNSYSGLNVEKIAGLKPDLILAIPGTADLKELAALKIPIAVLLPSSLNGVYHDIALVGEATGSGMAARKEIAKLRATVWSVQKAIARTAKRPYPSVFVELGASPYYTAGPGSFIDNVIHIAGGVNAVDKVSSKPWPALTTESVIAANPDVIILGDAPYTKVASVYQRPGWLEIRAVQDHKVFANINPDYLSAPSPALVIGIEQLAKDLHPGLVIR